MLAEFCFVLNATDFTLQSLDQLGEIGKVLHLAVHTELCSARM